MPVTKEYVVDGQRVRVTAAGCVCRAELLDAPKGPGTGSAVGQYAMDGHEWHKPSAALATLRPYIRRMIASNAKAMGQ